MCPYDEHRTVTHPGGHHIVTRPEGYPFQETTESATVQKQDLSSGTRRRPPSTSFAIALSIVLGMVIAAGTILGVVGNAFYVSRNEYTHDILKNAEETTTIKTTLVRIEHALSRQEAIFDKLSDIVQNIKVEIARKKQ